jgi:hypothetical protein
LLDSCIGSCCCAGAAASNTLMDQWDFWPLMALPIDEARSRINLLPHLVATA